jgi:molybdenum cofactor biosynthesis enzyme MoaA
MNKYVERLTDEWKQHGKIIIAVDFDDTISPWRYKSDEDEAFYKKVIEILKEAKMVGAYIVIFTACNEDRYDEIRNYCRKRGLDIDDINNVPIDLPYGKGRKLYANIFLDDRAGLREALATLSEASWRQRAHKHSSAVTIQNVEF